MKILNNNLSPLPFYDSLGQQHHRKDYAYGQIYPLVTYRNMLMPFQIALTHVNVDITEVNLHNLNTGDVVDITDNLFENGLASRVYDFSGEEFSIIKYPGTLPVIALKHEGRYYLSMRIRDLGVIYSEVFTVSNRVDNCLLLEYYNSKEFFIKNGGVTFEDNFKFKCYIPAQIGKPEYIFEEEATERMGYTFIESQVSKKVYKFTFLAPEYLCDALRLVRLCDNKRIVCKHQEYDLTTFNMEPKWEEQGDLASVECEFETDTVIANIGGYAPKLVGGDFNNDFNNDFR